MLNGYWQIVKVDFPSGESKAYKLGNSVDYIYLDGDKGYRKKVQPTIIGGFETSNDAQNFEISTSEGSFLMVYQNSLSGWTERLIEVQSNSFSVSNDEGIVYNYKRYEPINLTE